MKYQSRDRLVWQGDYVITPSGNLKEAGDREALAQEAMFRLAIRRGNFCYQPDLGSRFYQLSGYGGDWEETALEMAKEALNEMDGVQVEEVLVSFSEEYGRLSLDIYLSILGESVKLPAIEAR